MKIGALQLDISWENREENYKRVSEFADRASSSGVDLFVLPEMFATGFSMNPSVTAEERDGATYEFICNLAKEQKMAVISGLVFKGEGGKGINSAVAVDRQGRELSCYSKTHLYSVLDEHHHHIAGDSPKPFEFEGVNFSCSICYDLRFPELFRMVAKDVDVSIVIASWPNARQRHFDNLIEARAIENQHFIVGVNRVGSGGGLDYDGGTVIRDPMGRCLAHGENKECLIEADIDLQLIEETRKFMACHRDRQF